MGTRQAGLYLAGNAGDHLDLEIKAGKPIDPDRRPVWIWSPLEDLALHGHDGFELLLRIGMEGRYIDDVIKAAPCRDKRRLQIGEGQPNLIREVRFR